MQYCEAFVTENVNINRLYWHSRRGMWELDLLLVPFLEHRYRELSSQDQALYRTLIDNEDQDLFVWLMRREWPEDDGLRRIVKMIVEYAETTSNDQYRTL
ncbi:FAD assembly factor SdhE [Halomonas shantousis]